MHRMRLAVLVLVATVAPLLAKRAYETAPINYEGSVSRDPMVSLINSMRGREAEFRSLSEGQRLLWLLEALGVPVESQLLVFSKTSLQRRRIEPTRPRALYFSDEVYVGWVPGGLIEVTVFDPLIGAVFYSLDASAGPREPLALRGADCLSCHDQHEETPTLRARSVYPDSSGEPLGGSPSGNVDATTPIETRWGGWYVTGAPSDLQHRGNKVGASLGDFDQGGLARRIHLGLHADSPYPRRTSDVVALLVHDHQVHVHNVLVAAAQSSRIALHRWPVMKEVLRLPSDAPLSGSCLLILESDTRKVVRALLGADDAPWPGMEVSADPSFAAAYAKGRKVDHDGRSLRDLDLRSGLFIHRCSPLIYSATFRALPPELSSRVLEKLDHGLRSTSLDPDLAHLTSLQRRTLRQILRQTFEGLPSSWGG